MGNHKSMDIVLDTSSMVLINVRIILVRVYVFGRVCFNMSKILKLKYAHLRYLTRLVRCLKRVRV
jgi:hypothetical protein